MKLFFVALVALLLSSCFRFNGRITIHNDSESMLKISTVPIIASGSGGWENGIRYYNKDSIIWRHGLGYPNIKARILEPKFREIRTPSDTVISRYGEHYGDYSRFREDTTVRGVYLMYPNSSFTIGEFNTRKKFLPVKDRLQGKFTIDKLIVYRENDSLVANKEQEIWNLLLLLDKNPENFDKQLKRKKVRHWTVFIRP